MQLHQVDVSQMTPTFALIIFTKYWSLACRLRHSQCYEEIYHQYYR